MMDYTYTKMQSLSVTIMALILMTLSIVDVEAASRRNCNRALVINEVTELNFGNFVGSLVGKVTVTTSGSRSSTGPVLVGGGTVSPAVYSLHTTIAGCERYRVRIRFNNGNLGGPGANMRVNNFVSDPASLNLNLNPGANNPVFVTVGADVSSAASQQNGVYTGTYRVRFNLRN